MKMANQYMLVCFALCLTIVAALSVDKDSLNKPKRKQTLANTNDDDLSDASLEMKQNQAEDKEYYRWHQAGSTKIISAEEQFATCIRQLWATLTDAEARSHCALALGHVLTDEKKDQESTEEAAERQVLFEKATTAYDDLVTNMTVEETNLAALKLNASALTAEAELAKADVESFIAPLAKAQHENAEAYVPGRPGDYDEFQARDKQLENQMGDRVANKNRVDRELAEVSGEVTTLQQKRDGDTKLLRHATVKFRNYRAQHEAEIAPKKKMTKQSVKSSADRQFHVIGAAAIAMIALAY